MSLSLWYGGKGSPFSSIRKVATAFVDASLSSAIPLLVDDGELKGKARERKKRKLSGENISIRMVSIYERHQMTV